MVDTLNYNIKPRIPLTLSPLFEEISDPNKTTVYIRSLGEGVLSFKNLCPILLFSNNQICSNEIISPVHLMIGDNIMYVSKKIN